jgi:hypothetical protein
VGPHGGLVSSFPVECIARTIEILERSKPSKYKLHIYSISILNNVDSMKPMIKVHVAVCEP